MSSQFSAEELKLSWGRKNTPTWASCSNPTLTSSQPKHRLVPEGRVLLKPLSHGIPHLFHLIPTAFSLPE